MKIDNLNWIPINSKNPTISESEKRKLKKLRRLFKNYAFH